MRKYNRCYDIAIVGGGPAGAAMAKELTSRAYEVLIIDKITLHDFKIGESLAPAGNRFLDRLGIRERFKAQEHLALCGHASAWGSSYLMHQDFITQLQGPAWALDRLAFDRLLINEAVKSGAHLMKGELKKIRSWSPGGWSLQVECDSGPWQCKARFIADCSGRRSYVARNLGVGREVKDQLIGLWSLFKGDPCSKDQSLQTVIESGRTGWWYSLRLPGGYRACAFFTDAGNVQLKKMRKKENYCKAIKKTIHINQHLRHYHWALTGHPIGASANSARLMRWSGTGWLAAGDAAISFDPLSSQGIVNALYSGLEGANSIHQCFQGIGSGADTYNSKMELIWHRYLYRLQYYYQLEKRWPGSEFWQKRHGNFGTPAKLTGFSLG